MEQQFSCHNLPLLLSIYFCQFAVSPGLNSYEYIAPMGILIPTFGEHVHSFFSVMYLKIELESLALTYIHYHVQTRQLVGTCCKPRGAQLGAL